MAVDFEKMYLIYIRMIIGKNMKILIHYQVISKIFDAFRKNISEESFIIWLDAHEINKMITSNVRPWFNSCCFDGKPSQKSV